MKLFPSATFENHIELGRSLIVTHYVESVIPHPGHCSQTSAGFHVLETESQLEFSLLSSLVEQNIRMLSDETVFYKVPNVSVTKIIFSVVNYRPFRSTK